MENASSSRNILIAGIIMVLLNVALLAPMSTGAVRDAVIENFDEFSKESACDDDDCTTAEDDWAVSSSQRDFYGYSITNVNDVMASGATPTYEKIGPVTYDITTTRTITGYDATAGELTYNSVKSFECAEDTTVPCDTEVSQLNIAFQTQVIGATGLAIGGIMDMTKAGFTAGMIANDLENTIPASITASDLEMMLAYNTSVAGDAANGSILAGEYFYSLFNQYFAAMNLSGMGTSVNYTQAIQGAQQMAGEPVTFSGTEFSDITHAFNTATMPSGENVSMTSSLGVMAFAGHCDANPTENYSMVMADIMAAAGDPTAYTSGVMQRGGIWGYADTDINATIARDHAMCFGVGGQFLNAGGTDDTYLASNPASVNATRRMANFGFSLDDNSMALNVLLAGHNTSNPTGLLAVSEDGTSYGVANFMSMSTNQTREAFGISEAQHNALALWAGGWLTDVTSLPMVLLGGSGEMTASLFVNTTFGAEDPLNGGYLENSLNLGGFWGLPEGRDNIALDPAVSGNALYGPLGLTTSTGSAIFLYGELSGMTPPLNFSTSPPTPGTPMVWDEATIGALYGVDTNAAAAMRALMMGPIYGTTAESFVPGFLMSSFGATPYLTQSFNNWLLGWHDPVSAFLATGNPMDYSAGWTSLETNETYFSSDVLNGGVAVMNGDGTNYTMCTGEGGDCDQGETLAEDGSTQLSWRNDAMFAATFGLISPESLVGTTGGFLTGDGDKVDVSGYAIADVDCEDTAATVKGIPVKTCSASVVATERNIQANLLETYSLLDATPGALPVYFGSEISMSAEEISGLIIAGESSSTFYLDTRAHTNQASTPSMDDLVPVFEIKSSSMIDTDDAEEMESAIVTNQDSMMYWTNFDHPIDFVTLLFWLGGIVLIAVGMVSAANAPEEKEYTADTSEAETESSESDAESSESDADE